jgi:hypothetical protein
MNPKFSSKFPVAAIFVAVALTGCAANPATRAHPEAASTQSSMAMGPESAGRGMMMSDAEMKSMCEMHQQMMSAKTPGERKAIMAAHMKTMSPQMMQHHRMMMQMMQEQMANPMPSK